MYPPIFIKLLLVSRFLVYVHCMYDDETKEFLYNSEGTSIEQQDIIKEFLPKALQDTEDTTHLWTENETSEEISPNEQNNNSSYLLNVPFDDRETQREVETESRALNSEEELFVTTTSSTTSYDSEESSLTTSMQYKIPTTGVFTKKPVIESLGTNEDETGIRSILHQNGLNQEYLQKQEELYQKKIKTSTAATTIASTIAFGPSSTISPNQLSSPKRSKTMKSYRSKANDVLRKFVENEYLRTPLACIVDTTNDTVRKSQILWNTTLRPNVALDMVLAGYNASGSGAIYTFKNTRSFLVGLHNLRESPRYQNHSRAFAATLEISDLIPYDSAIFLCTDQIASDLQNYDRVATTLIKKRIRFYLIWFGWAPNSENETLFSKTGEQLGELALTTGGEILHIPNISNDEDLGVVTLFARRGINDVFDISDSTVTSFYTPRTLPDAQSATEITLNDFPLKHDLSKHKFVRNISVNEDTVEQFNIEKSPKKINRSARQSIVERSTIIETSLQSQLLVSPGSSVRIIFDVTNMGEQIAFHNFQVTGERSWLIDFKPRSAYISPKQTIQVTIIAQIPQSAEIGTTDKVTLFSQSLSVVSQSAYVRVLSTGSLQDPNRPYLHYTFGARCDGRTDPGNCATGFWTLEITTADWQTGILRLESDPKGLIIRAPYVAGTKDDVRATYTASCCQPRVTVTSYDVARNPSTFTVDVRDIWLSPAGIAAVVLGVLVGVLLIIMIILGIVWCWTRNRESRELPVYRTDSRTSRR